MMGYRPVVEGLPDLGTWLAWGQAPPPHPPSNVFLRVPRPANSRFPRVSALTSGSRCNTWKWEKGAPTSSSPVAGSLTNARLRPSRTHCSARNSGLG